MSAQTLRLTHTRDVKQVLLDACAKIAPVWPLESFVAVNPYLGLAHQDFSDAAHWLRAVAGARMTLPTRFYLEAFDQGAFVRQDVEAALAHAKSSQPVSTFLTAARAAARNSEVEQKAAVATVGDVASSITGTDWGRFATERVSAWAAAYFDDGQAAWRPQPAPSVYAAWRAEAAVDRTPELMGLKGFRRIVGALPASAIDAASEALELLDLPADALPLYLHALLMRTGGWAAYAARIVWEQKLYRDRDDEALLEFLCVLLGWEAATYQALQNEGIADAWNSARQELIALNSSTLTDENLERDLVLHAAYERGMQRKLTASLDQHADRKRPTASAQRPHVQAVFCIDVRSEVFRRHFEAVESGIETLGFAGFFAFPIRYTPIAHARAGAQCPVLLKPAYSVLEGLPDANQHALATTQRRTAREIARAWRAFKLGAVSCFAFVSPVGLGYLPKLIANAFGLGRPVPHPLDDGLERSVRAAKGPLLDWHGSHDQGAGISLDARIELATGALRAMSLTSNFARLVMITGHGSTTVNNPHASGLDCGACGGRTGEANARVAAAVLNDPQVRRALCTRGIAIPEDTIFLSAQHDTTTDSVTIFNREDVPHSHMAELHELDRWLAQAGAACRAERGQRLAIAADQDIDDAIFGRSKDWAQVRPEWGLAGCSAFIVAPRQRTHGLNLQGRTFMHSYQWQHDTDFKVLELIMTAPMVVTSWINLQYYGSTVDNQLFGCGNKTLHNVAGTVGVFEGNGGDLRVGLPWQSLHDGEKLQHLPLRLSVIIEAPTEAMNPIIARHQNVRQLLDNGWLNLWAMDERGKIAYRYVGDLQWQSLRESSSARKTEQLAVAVAGATANEQSASTGDFRSQSEVHSQQSATV